jgi:hypothetical protein
MTVFKRRKIVVGNIVDYAALSDSGIPYLWGSGNVSEGPSFSGLFGRPGGNVVNAQLGGSSYLSVGSQGLAIGGGVIVARNVNGNNAAAADGEVFVWDYLGDLLGTTGTGIISSPVVGSSYRFGCNVSVSTGGKIVISAQNGSRGAVYLYDRFATQLGFINGPFTNGRFGKATAIGCGKIVVGRPEGRGINDTEYPSGRLVGEIRIYDNYTLNTANETTVIIPKLFTAEGDDGASAFCGNQVDIGCGRIIAAAPFVGGTNRGVVYVLDLAGNPIKRIEPPNPQSFQEFGASIAVGCGLIVIGSPGYDQTAGGNQGAVYVYDLDGNLVFERFGAIGASLGQWVSIGSGRIVASSPGFGAGEVTIFDLDGNIILERFNQSNSTGDEFGDCHKIRDGFLLIGAPGTGGVNDTGTVYQYDTPDVFTLYDAVDLKYG